MPGKSVCDKIANSDGLIWMDYCQYVKEGYTNRNRLPDGSWLTVPVTKHPTDTKIIDIRIALDAKWRQKLINRIKAVYPAIPKDDRLYDILRFPYPRLFQLNQNMFWLMWDRLGLERPYVVHQSLLRPAGDVSEQHASMVEHMGGTVYMSGPTGRKYLDETPFTLRGIEVRYWKHEGPNPSILERYAATFSSQSSP